MEKLDEEITKLIKTSGAGTVIAVPASLQVTRAGRQGKTKPELGVMNKATRLLGNKAGSVIVRGCRFSRVATRDKGSRVRWRYGVPTVV